MCFGLIGNSMGADASHVRSRTKDIELCAAIEPTKNNRRINAQF